MFFRSLNWKVYLVIYHKKLISYGCFKFLPKNTSASTLSGFKAGLQLLTINPAFEKNRLASVNVAGMQRKFLATKQGVDN